MPFDFRKWIVLPLVLAFAGGGVIFAQVISELREKELQVSLQNIDEGLGSGKALGLIARYQQARRRFQTRSEGAGDYLDEIKSLAVLQRDFNGDTSKQISYPALEKPAIVMVNALSRFLGAPPMLDIRDNTGRKMLEVAYFFERKREFERAAVVYDAALKYYPQNIPETPYIHLHRGFCNSVAGAMVGALADFERVVQLDPYGEMGVTAEILSRFLSDVAGHIARVDAMENSAEKGEAYYRLMAYQKAIKTLSELTKRGEAQNVYFYRGRSYEEIGRIPEAIRDYSRVLSIDSGSDFALNANRRLYLLATTYGKNEKMKEETTANAAKMGDGSFIAGAALVEKALDVSRMQTQARDDSRDDLLRSLRKKHSGTFEAPAPGVAVATPSVKIVGPVIRRDMDPARITPELLLDPVLNEAQRRRLLRIKFTAFDKIFTADGRVFVGAVTNQQEDVLEMLTVKGPVQIRAERITMRLRAKDTEL